MNNEGDEHIRLVKAAVKATFQRPPPWDYCSGYAPVSTELYARWTCSYCKGVRSGKDDECTGCGAPRWA